MKSVTKAFDLVKLRSLKKNSLSLGRDEFVSCDLRLKTFLPNVIPVTQIENEALVGGNVFTKDGNLF